MWIWSVIVVVWVGSLWTLDNKKKLKRVAYTIYAAYVGGLILLIHVA